MRSKKNFVEAPRSGRFWELIRTAKVRDGLYCKVCGDWLSGVRENKNRVQDVIYTRIQYLHLYDIFYGPLVGIVRGIWVYFSSFWYFVPIKIWQH
jgi:hypothetical protein